VQVIKVVDIKGEDLPELFDEQAVTVKLPLVLGCLALPINAIASTCSNTFTISSTTCNLSTAPQTPQSIPSANDDISFNVSHNLKKNNISGEYIDLAQLLQNPSVNGDKHD
jgi:hypothetical protein